jgi:hypothetical protein
LTGKQLKFYCAEVIDRYTIGLIRALAYISKNDNEDMERKNETTKEMISIYPL